LPGNLSRQRAQFSLPDVPKALQDVAADWDSSQLAAVGSPEKVA
jgi:hypothetical protein